MSRIGKLPISIPEKVTITVSDDNTVTVKGPKGELSQKVDPSIVLNIENGQVVLDYADGKTIAEATKQEHAYHGLYRALVNNMVTGVSTGFKKELELVGVGYRVKPRINSSVLAGFSFTR